jgi:hypothetical protein
MATLINLQEGIAGEEAVSRGYSEKNIPPGYISHPDQEEVPTGQTSICSPGAVPRAKLRMPTFLTGRTTTGPGAVLKATERSVLRNINPGNPPNKHEVNFGINISDGSCRTAS